MKTTALTTSQIGAEAEQDACRYLMNKGYGLLEKNYRCYHGEIDLIMQDENCIVFVEVRYRHRVDYGNAFDSITPTKKRRLYKTAKHYLQAKKCLYKLNSRFDVIAIHPRAGKLMLEWIKNAFTIDGNYF